ncbi:MAG: Unknown protein [uncultured Campylobacterales bacterium]|uniref:Plasminogen-binding protein PgbA N-terminal domain-containing protein n=1 Tax=uncultured Campylobacterales bacterium TaxID=352960 RepID=A0A6S6RYP2_9BACT|nr:MAG: Unknown protein [uncultured Campylobacterales bacterium]
MFRSLIMIFSLFSFCLGNDVYESKIIDIKDNKIYVKTNASNSDIGTSGVLIRKVNNQNLIVSKLNILNVDKNITILELNNNNFTNKALPKLKQDIRLTDKVIIKYGYKRVLPIVKNDEFLSYVKTKFPQYQFVLNDIFRIEANKKQPTKKLVRKFCKFYDLNLLLIKVNNDEYFVDCNSFKLIGKSFGEIEKSLSSSEPWFEDEEFFYNLFGVK